jgi:deazaflavin-dependent oxidoreductase (nitroreductase family)
MSSEHAGRPRPREVRTGGNAGNAPRDARSARGVRRAALDSLKGFIGRRLNPHILALAGSPRLPLFAVVLHRGRRSGRPYATPVGARRTPGGFVIPLTFGEEADWFQNVRAAGGCVIRWKGADYPVVEPEIVDWAAARSAFSPVERVLVPLIGIKQFARVHFASEGGNAVHVA